MILVLSSDITDVRRACCVITDRAGGGEKLKKKTVIDVWVTAF